MVQDVWVKLKCRFGHLDFSQWFSTLHMYSFPTERSIHTLGNLTLLLPRLQA